MRLRAQGARLVVVAGSPDVMRGFSLTGLDRVVPIHATRADALAA